MTKEQAIDLLDNLIGFIEDNHGSDYDEALKLAIKALKQEPCEDAISRQAVLKPYQTLKDNDTICIWLLRKNIEQQIPVTPQQRWIPVSERMPEEHTSVIGTTEFNDIYEAELYNDCGKNKWYADGNYDVPIVAWMPLPEPYKAESEET